MGLQQEMLDHAEITRLRAEIERLRGALRYVINHWHEFGPEDGFDEAIHCAEKALYD